MFKPVHRQVAIAWCAMLAILCSALAPTLLHARAAEAAGATGAAATAMRAMQICTMSGMKSIVVAADTVPAPVGIDLFDHCANCLTHCAPPALPAVAEFVFPAAALFQPYPPLFYRSAHPLFTWTAAHPRAPPR